MSLQEIEAAVSKLSSEELKRLTDFLSSFRREHPNGARTFKGAEAIAWWHEVEHLGFGEADAFAADIASARAEVRPPVSRWE